MTLLLLYVKLLRCGRTHSARQNFSVYLPKNSGEGSRFDFTRPWVALPGIYGYPSLFQLVAVPRLRDFSSGTAGSDYPIYVPDGEGRMPFHL